MGIGATVRLYAEGRAGEAEHLIGRADITIGNGYSCGDEALAHFGLNDRKRCDVEISWQGRRVVRAGVAAGQYLTIPVGAVD